MKLTPKQKEVIDRYKALESEYGKGNVFLRWINDYWKVCFVVHKKGEDTFTFFGGDENRVNGRILNSFEEKGLLIPCDNAHNEGADPNSWRSQPEGWCFVGSKINVELAEA